MSEGASGLETDVIQIVELDVFVNLNEIADGPPLFAAVTVASLMEIGLTFVAPLTAGVKMIAATSSATPK